MTLDQSVGPIAVYIDRGLTQRGVVDLVGIQPGRPVIGLFGTNAAFVEQSLHSVIIAPNAQLVIGPGSQDGVFFARRVEVRAGTLVTFAP